MFEIVHVDRALTRHRFVIARNPLAVAIRPVGVLADAHAEVVLDDLFQVALGVEGFVKLAFVAVSAVEAVPKPPLGVAVMKLVPPVSCESAAKVSPCSVMADWPVSELTA